ncbi:hypothetical protein N7532_000914 [Penicillium argentinense]|uniref:Peptidase metallopeptidase domain-containing protein n=1 Tax=Penicillium argentinense TaxID=1131581 RepID=A0A9W9G1G3_9EURO|nr:uncharacterized protein N7532_000914 [Penicillium argentinense]KAJ5110379.1 hypothetical protein N7532_000914 [Penicillium argentinense]
MPHSSNTINPARASFIQDLKGAVGLEALKTLDPNATEVHSPPPATGSTTRLERYPCTTQKPMPATIAGITNVAALQVGYGKVIPRWKTGSTKTVNFAAFENGYPKPELAFLAATKLKEAADEWNALKLGIQLNWVYKIEDAAFVLSYAKNDNPAVLAEAFFPNDLDLNVLNVYPAAFEPGAVQYLKNIFLHELGHVLGFRHEFAPELESDEQSVQIGPRNPTSVMAYEFPPQLQPSDIENAKTFYQFPGKYIGQAQGEPKWGLMIVDYDANN